MLPIPTHLKDFLIPIGDENSENLVDGIIRCSCNCEHFRVNNNFDIDDISNKYSSVIKAICSNCDIAYLIFDSRKHGWDGFVCHHEDSDGTWMGESPPDEVLIPHICKKCKSDDFLMEIGIRSEGKADFINESGIADGETDFNEDDWVNAFGWITVSLTCSACGYKENSWIDLETM